MSRFANSFTMDDVRRFWDGISAEYDRENELVGRIHTQRFRDAMKRLDPRPGMRILNVWSRAGGAVPYLRRLCPDLALVNLELSRALAEIASRRYPGECFAQASLHEFPVRTESIDAVLALETLEHVPDPLLFLEEARRVLVPGGSLVMSLPPGAAEWSSLLNSFLRFHHGEGPHRFLPPAEVKRLLAEAGFTLLEHRGTLFIPALCTQGEKLDVALTRLFGGGPLAQLGLRQFYVATAPR